MKRIWKYTREKMLCEKVYFGLVCKAYAIVLRGFIAQCRASKPYSVRLVVSLIKVSLSLDTLDKYY